MGRPEKGGWLAFVMDLIYLVISTPVPLSLCCKEKKKINTSDQWLQRFSLSSAPFLTGCHSLLATQTCLIPLGDSYSLPDFQLSAESTALSVVHFEGLWQEAMLCFRAAERKDRSSRSTRKKRRSGAGRRRRCRGEAWLQKQAIAKAALRKSSNSSWLRVSLVPPQ